MSRSRLRVMRPDDEPLKLVASGSERDYFTKTSGNYIEVFLAENGRFPSKIGVTFGKDRARRAQAMIDQDIDFHGETSDG